MKKITLIAALCASSLLGSMSALAADTQTVSVSASVLGTCKFSATIAAVVFTAIDPSTTGTKTAPLSLTYKCTKGTLASAITISAGTNTPMVGALATPDTIPFTVGTFTAAVAGTGFSGTASSSGTILSIAQAAYQDVKADTYTGSLVVNIAP